MRDAKRALTLADLASLAERFAVEPQPALLYAAIDTLVQEVIGHRLFTLMRVHEATDEVERVYSSNTAAYPVGGRKVKRGTPWSRAVLDRGEVFVARNAAEVQDAFADHALIFSLGIGSIVNVPIAWAGRRLGTMRSPACAPSGRGASDHRPHRAERCRQDDTLQLHLGRRATERGQRTPLLTLYVKLALLAGGLGNNRGAIVGAFAVVFLLESTRFVIPFVPGITPVQGAAIREFLIAAFLIGMLRYEPGGLVPEPPTRLPVPPPAPRYQPTA